MKQKYLVTPALPYANGPLHLGHLLEHVQVNLFVRALRMAGLDTLYICGADSHGTPIEMNALKANIPASEFAETWRARFEASFKDFGIEFDGGFGSTDTKENEFHAVKIFEALKKKGYIKTREIEQLFDPELNRFLPDRMVRGTCPKCRAPEQYGDSCESCGRTYHPTELIEPKSALSGATPVMKKSLHYFVSLGQFEKELKDFVYQSGAIHDDTRAFLERWFSEGLKDWDISRDGPYFGFLIPGETDKYFYVWLDAPIGYISISEKAAKERALTFENYWLEANTKIYHFIGKDIVYFHTLFWPAMLMAAEYTLPHQVVVHGMLTIDGEKMSKSRGTFILADTFKKHVNPEALRYYFACKLSQRSEDIDLNLHDFTQRVNTDLVNKVVNIISRVVPLLHRSFNGTVSVLDQKAELLTDKCAGLVTDVKNYYLTNEPGRALNEIVRMAEEVNRYLQESAPWQKIKDDPAHAHAILTTGLYLGKVCFALLKPVLPNAVKILETMVNNDVEFTFDTIANRFVEGSIIKPYHNLFERIDDTQIAAMIEESKQGVPKKVEHMANPIQIQQFIDVDLRAAMVVSAEEVNGSDKLIACVLDVGELGTRHVFSGLRPHVTPTEMVGKTVALVANLAPRKMRFGVSEGMILAGGSDDKPQLLTLNGVKPGDRLR